MSLLFSCKENGEDNKVANVIKKQKDTITQNIHFTSINNNNKTIRIDWIFDKVESLSNSYKCDNISKYKELIIGFSNDSVFIKNVYTDDVFSGEIKADAIYKRLGLSKEFILNKFNLTIPEKVKYVRNKKAFQSNSILDEYFQDAFFIEDYLLFEKDGCVYKFKKSLFERKVVNHKKLKLPVSSEEIEKINPVKIDNIIFKEYSCGSDAYGYYLIK